MNDSTVYVTNNTWEEYGEMLRSWLEDPGVEDHNGLNMTELKMDQAYVVGVADKKVGVYSVSDDCFRCPFELQKTLYAGAEDNWIASTARRSTWRVYADASDRYISTRNTTNLICQLRPELGEFGVYRLNTSGEGCYLHTEKEPVDIYRRGLAIAVVCGWNLRKTLLPVSWQLISLVAFYDIHGSKWSNAILSYAVYIDNS